MSAVSRGARVAAAVLCAAIGWLATGSLRAGQTGPPASGDWTSYGLTAEETRFSPLLQIDATSVSRLGRAWIADLGDGSAGQEATPLVSQGVMYVVTNWSLVYAFDAKTGRLIWRWDPAVDRTIAAPGTSRICCGVVNRGLAIDAGRLFVPVIDGRLVALDAKTGTVVWTAQATPKDDIAYSLTIAPRVVRGKVLIGNSGAEFPPYRGFFSAFDSTTGRELWRFYTVPGDPKRPFENPALEAAARTWTGEWWKYGGGGSVWDGMAYDAEANLLYVGIGNPTPWPVSAREQTPANDNLYTNSILAVDPDRGTLKWHYQPTPADAWDYDATAQLLLATLRIEGRDRRVVMQANKNGFFYVIDRLTGELVSAEPFTKVSWARGIDMKTGRPMINDGAYYGTSPVTIAPSGFGAHNWMPMSFSPATGLAYIPATLGSTMSFAAVEKFEFTPGVMNLGLNRARGRGAAPAPATGAGTTIPPAPAGPPAPAPATGPPSTGPEGTGAHLVAWDPVTQKERWRQPGGGSGGTLATAGGLVFQTTNDGRIVAYAADTGEKRFEAPLSLRGAGPPMTYAVDGRQYVAVITPNPARVHVLTLDAPAVAPPVQMAPPARGAGPAGPP